MRTQRRGAWPSLGHGGLSRKKRYLRWYIKEAVESRGAGDIIQYCIYDLKKRGHWVSWELNRFHVTGAWRKDAKWRKTGIGQTMPKMSLNFTYKAKGLTPQKNDTTSLMYSKDIPSIAFMMYYSRPLHCLFLNYNLT